MKEGNRTHRKVLEGQLDHLQRLLGRPNAAQWREIEGWAVDFRAWLGRAKPWIGCASRLIDLRVGRIVEGNHPEWTAVGAWLQLSVLLEEARNQWESPRQDVQVLDLEPPEGAGAGLILFPAELCEWPENLQPTRLSSIPYRYYIPN